MPSAYVDDPTFIRVCRDSKSATQAAEKLGYKGESAKRSFLRRRARIEEKYGSLGLRNDPPKMPLDTLTYHLDHPFTGVFFSDAHFWPEEYCETSPAYWILLEVIQHIEPELVNDGGDSVDFAAVSRHPRLGFEEVPQVHEEIEATQTYKGMIEETAKDADLFYQYGNHCERLETWLANKAPQMEGFKGVSLKEMFPNWQISASLIINDTLWCNHKWRGGKHAAYNNALHAGKSALTGHDHRLTARPIRDLNGVRYGISTGTLAWPYGPQFKYTRSTPLDWHCGFMVIHFDGKDIHPEPVMVEEDGSAWWSGRRWRG